MLGAHPHADGTVVRVLRPHAESVYVLPNGERDLAHDLGVSRSTVREALAALEKADEVLRVPGRGGGTFVRGRKVERDLSRVVGVPALLVLTGWLLRQRRARAAHIEVRTFSEE